MRRIRPCRDDERDAILAIINSAAESYRGVIPDDRWHEPYMESRELESEIADGVRFWGYEADGELIGAMGVQPVHDVAIRFYRRYGFELVSPERRTALLKTYWRIPDRQIETSVVLAHPPLDEA
jgi:hypothetical protein